MSSPTYAEQEAQNFGENSVSAIIARDQEKPSHPNGPNTMWGFGNGLRKALQGGPSFLGRLAEHTTLNNGPLVGGLAGAAGLGALGYGAGKILDWTSDDEEGGRGRIGAAIGSALGLGLGAYAGYKRAGSTLDDIQTMLSQDFTISSGERATLMKAVTQLDTNSINSLSLMVRTVGASAVGALVAKFLFGAGKGGMLLGGLLGGMAGAATFSPTGAGHLESADLYGNPYRI